MRDYSLEKDADYHPGRDYIRDKDRDYTSGDYAKERDYQKELSREHESDYHWDRREPRRESYQTRDFDVEQWESRYREKLLDYSSAGAAVKSETYRRLPQRPQSFSAAESSGEPPRRKLPQIPIRGGPGTRPSSSYVQSTSTRYRSLDEERQQPPQYHSNPLLSVGGHLPTHYESYYHELRLAEAKTSPHSSLRQLPPTPSEMVTGHRRTNSSGSFDPQRIIGVDPDSKYAGHRFSYQEGDTSASSRLTRYGMGGGQRNFSSLPRNHGGAVHYKDQTDYYRSMVHHDQSPKRVSTLLDDPFMSYHTDEHSSYPLYTGADDEDLEADLLRRRRLLEEALAAEDLHGLDDPTYPHSSYRDSQRYSGYVDDDLALEKSLKSPDYYDYEARYTQMSTDPRTFGKLSDRIGLPEDTYLERSPQLHHRLGYPGVGPCLSPSFKDWERHEAGADYRDREYDRDVAGAVGRAAAEDQPRVRVKHQLSWEQYSPEDQTEDLKYVVSEPGNFFDFLLH